MKIFKENFQYLEIDKINNDSIVQMASEIGIKLDPDKISVKSDWKKFKKYFVYDENKKPILFIKHMWENTGTQELIALHMAKYIFDPELIPDNYLFGFFYPKGNKKKPEPYLMTTIVPGSPIKKFGWEKYAFNLGRQFQLHQILNVHDCELRHFFADEKDNVRRIDFGLSFFKMKTRYRGFEEYMPKGLPYMSKFWRGYRLEGGKIDVMLLNTRPMLKKLLDNLQHLKFDDFVNFDGKEFIDSVKHYWDIEKLSILDYVSRLKEPEEEPNV